MTMMRAVLAMWLSISGSMSDHFLSLLTASAKFVKFNLSSFSFSIAFSSSS